MSKNQFDVTYKAKNGSIYVNLFEEDPSAPAEYSNSGMVNIPPGKYFVNLYPLSLDEDGYPKLTRNGKKMVSLQFKPFEPRGDKGYSGNGEGRAVRSVPQGASDGWEKVDNSPEAHEPDDTDDDIPF